MLLHKLMLYAIHGAGVLFPLQPAKHKINVAGHYLEQIHAQIVIQQNAEGIPPLAILKAVL